MDKSTQYKLFNDPVHGFITVPKGIVLNLIDHAYMQRLRRIRQLGMGYLVFPGAEHSRFAHAIGSLELMQRVLNNLREKDTTISPREYEGALIAIILHDIGHGPLSHTLENTLIKDFSHELMTRAIMERLNKEFEGKLDTALEIFTNQHPKAFLHQLISSQLDIDRLDYLKRDSFYTGVYEGSVGIDRILKTMRVHNGHVVIEKKGIYAIENYILARRLMYMQVYLHKTVISADHLLNSIFKRVRILLDSGYDLFLPSPSLRYFLTEQPSARQGISSEMLDYYVHLDDNDVFLSIKYWKHEEDPILSDLCERFLNRTLGRTSFLKTDPSDGFKDEMTRKTMQALKARNLPHDRNAASYYLHFDRSYSEAYQYEEEGIWILESDAGAVEFSKAADTKNVIALTEPVVKPFCVHLKSIDLHD